ncbi:AmmeMemoRadiSam system protein B [Thermodesulfobacteriota bacterium]
MKQSLNPLIITLLAFCMICFPFIGKVHADNIRNPVWAGRFYPSQRAELELAIDRLTREAESTQVQIPSHKSLKALILPHAGYIFSGRTAAHASLVLTKNQFSKVILLAADHHVGFNDGVISDVTAYETPLGRIKLHDDASKLRRQSEIFQALPASDQREHSLEVVLPFLQRYLEEFELVPIVLGPCHIGRITESIDPLLDPNTLLVVSSDLSHYLSYADAKANDTETIKMILNLEADKLLKRKNIACGIRPILILINLARLHGWQPVLLHYSNSGDTAGDRSRVVGYAAIAFYGGSTMQNNSDSAQPLSHEQGQVLVKLARQTVMERLGQKMADAEADVLGVDLTDIDFQVRRGTFVTLHIDGQLRGCIGSLAARESIIDSVKHNAINAAFRDPRFPPLTTEELDTVDFEVSLLSEPQPLEYRDSEDLLRKLRVNVDGVILRKGSNSATYLPQVWEQLPRPEDFLSHLCKKAGLSFNAWKKTHLEVLTYQVQYFEEEK